MRKKPVSGIVLILLLTSMLSSALLIQPVEAGGTIYIRADGSVDPPTAPIQRDGDIYTFTYNIYDSIVVQRNNIVIDGAGYTVQGTGAGGSTGISLSDRSNVTIKNVEIKAFHNGIYLFYSSYNSISGNNIANNWYGIYLWKSRYNSISGNNIANNRRGISLYESHYSSISGNTITANNEYGIHLGYSRYSSISGNVFVDDGLRASGSYGSVVVDNLVNGKPLVYLEGVSDYTVEDAGQVILVNCNNITVENLNLSRTSAGLQLWETTNTNIMNNNIANNWYGIYLFESDYNSISGNNIADNEYGIHLWYSSDNRFWHNDFTDNTQQVYSHVSGYANVWDAGYPAGGNYWSDYTERYPDAEELDGSGIWDTPYVIDEYNQDNYPLMKPWTPVPPEVPNPPTLISPGSSSSPGEENYTLTPAFKWNSVPGADQYGLYIRDLDSNELIFDSQAREITITGTSYTLPSGILQWGKHYRWNMNSHNEAGWGEFSPPLYFYTAQLDLLSKIIQQEMQEKVTVTVDDKEYYIVTIKRYIEPLTWEPSDYTSFIEAPDILKAYTDTDFVPVFNRQLAKKIGIIDRTNNLLKHAGAPSNILVQLEAIDHVLEADEELATAEYTAVWAKTAIFMILDLTFYVEIEQPLQISSIISDIIMGQLEYYVDDPGRFILEGGRVLLEAAKQHYEEAKNIAEESMEGMHNYDAAKKYLNSFYSAYLKQSYGVDIVLPRERISQSAFWEVVGWIPDYINHLGSKLVSHISIWHKIGVDSTKVFKIAKGVAENIDKLSEFLAKIKEMENKVAQLVEDESFPVDYTQALLYRSKTLLKRWRINIVDHVPWEEIGVYYASPGELRVYDSSGNITGTVKGEIRMEIPNSFYYNNTVRIFFPNNTYTIEVMGTGEGLHSLTVVNMTEQEIAIFNATDIPTSPNTIHQYTVDWGALYLGEEGVTVMVDSDSDGVFEHTFTSDSELAQSEYVATIKVINTWITDSDFNETESFRAVFTPYDNTELYKLTATNPGQFYFNILVNNTWPEPQNLMINYSIDPNFTMKGARPIHVYADLNRTIDITANCTFSDNTITVYNLAPNDTAYVTMHLDYALKKTTWTEEEMEAWYSEHTFNATVSSITSKVVITDP